MKAPPSAACRFLPRAEKLRVSNGLEYRVEDVCLHNEEHGGIGGAMNAVGVGDCLRETYGIDDM